MTIFATGRYSIESNILRTIGTLPEPTIAFLFNGIQEVFADNLGGGLRTLTFLLTKDFFQLVTIPISIGLLSLLVTVIRMNILLGRFTCVEVQIVTIFATSTLIATASFEEGAQYGFGIFSESKLHIKSPHSYFSP